MVVRAGRYLLRAVAVQAFLTCTVPIISCIIRKRKHESAFLFFIVSDAQVWGLADDSFSCKQHFLFGQGKGGGGVTLPFV